MSLAPILCGIERWWRPNRGRERTAEILPMLCEGVRQRSIQQFDELFLCTLCRLRSSRPQLGIQLTREIGPSFDQ